MKKFVMIAFVAAATIFTACNSKTENAANTEAAGTEAVVEETATTTESSALDRYAEIVEKVIALQGKAKQGDAEAIKELTALSQEIANMATQLQAETANMTPEQAQRFTELAQKLQDAAMAN